MVLVTRQAPDFTAAAVLGSGEIVENFNLKKTPERPPCCPVLLAYGLHFRLSFRVDRFRPPLRRIPETWR